MGIGIGLMNLYRYRFDTNPNRYIGVSIGMDMMSERQIGIGMIGRSVDWSNSTGKRHKNHRGIIIGCYCLLNKCNENKQLFG